MSVYVSMGDGSGDCLVGIWLERIGVSMVVVEMGLGTNVIYGSAVWFLRLSRGIGSCIL